MTTKPKPTKIDQVLKLIKRSKGASLAELEKATGWQRHSIRAALTGLRKKGNVIERAKRGDNTVYLLVEKA